MASDGEPAAECKLYIGGLNYRTNDDDLYELFSKYGDVVKTNIRMHQDDPNRSRGFGFVEFNSRWVCTMFCSPCQKFDYWYPVEDETHRNLSDQVCVFIFNSVFVPISSVICCLRQNLNGFLWAKIGISEHCSF